ncbi:MAG: YpiF family protein [Bacillus sp. (in: firmicutes)]
MKWIPKDLEMYNQAKEYVDTLIIPLHGITFNGGMNQSASNVEFISVISQQIEKQFKGRVLLLPAVNYYHGWAEEEKKEMILRWEGIVDKDKFPHVFFLTSDVFWKESEVVFDESLIWIPSIPLESLEDKYKKSVVEKETKNILDIIIRKWRNM